VSPLFRDRFFVPGAAKGKARPRAVAIGGHVRVYPGKADLEWKVAIRLAIHARMPDCQIDVTSPVRVALRFLMQRPKAHFGAKGLKPMAPTLHVGKPDIDNAAGAVMDAVTESGLWLDDNRVAELFAAKVYTVKDEVPGVWIEIEELPR